MLQSAMGVNTVTGVMFIFILINSVVVVGPPYESDMRWLPSSVRRPLAISWSYRQEAWLLHRDRAMLHVIEYFFIYFKVIESDINRYIIGLSVWHRNYGSVLYHFRVISR